MPACAAGLLLAGCGGPGVPLSGPPTGVVLDRGGAVQVLDRMPGGHLRTVAGSSRASGSDPLALTDVRQLSPRRIAGLRQGRLVTLDPAHPATARAVAPATGWFPDSAGTGAWTVTEPVTARPCPDYPGGSSPMPRYRLEHRRLSNGSVERSPFLLPCGTRPLADTASGFLVETVPAGAHPDHGEVPTEIRIVARGDFHVVRQLAADASLFDAAGGTVLYATSACAAEPCVHVVRPGARSRPRVGRLPHGGDLIGSGTLDATGRYLASASVSPDGDTFTLVVCDLRTGSVKDLGGYRTPTPGVVGVLAQDMPSLWSGSRFLFADPDTGVLTAYDAASGRRQRWTGLGTAVDAEVWGAAG